MDTEKKCELSFIPPNQRILGASPVASKAPGIAVRLGQRLCLVRAVWLGGPCLLFAAETASSRGISSGRLWNLGSGPTHLLVGGRRWWKMCLGKTQMGMWTSNLALNSWWPKEVALMWVPEPAASALPTNLGEMHILRPRRRADQLTQKLWRWVPVICVLRSSPGSSEHTDLWERTPCLRCSENRRKIVYQKE